MTRPDLTAARHLLAALDLDAARGVPPHAVRTGARSDALAADLRALLAAWDAEARDEGEAVTRELVARHEEQRRRENYR